MMRLLLCCLCLVLSPITAYSNDITKARPTPSMTFTTFNAYTLSQTVSAILTSAYQKLGIEISIDYLPGNRALQTSNTGAVDGELFRIAGIDKKFTNLIPVPEPIIELQTTVYSTKLQFNVESWQSLKPYKLGFLRGFRKAELKTKGMNIYQDNSLTHLFKLLEKGRIELVIESKLGASVILQHNDFPTVRALSPPVDKFKIYHYLHAKNAKYIAPLAQTLLQMRQSGEIQQIIDDTVLKLAYTKKLKRELLSAETPD